MYSTEHLLCYLIQCGTMSHMRRANLGSRSLLPLCEHDRIRRAGSFGLACRTNDSIQTHSLWQERRSMNKDTSERSKDPALYTKKQVYRPSKDLLKRASARVRLHIKAAISANQQSLS